LRGYAEDINFGAYCEMPAQWALTDIQSVIGVLYAGRGRLKDWETEVWMRLQHMRQMRNA